jgi:hypothetical protein
LVQLAARQRPADREIHRRIVAWIGGQMVRWGLALQQYGPHSQRPSRAAAVNRVR